MPKSSASIRGGLYSQSENSKTHKVFVIHFNIILSCTRVCPIGILLFYIDFSCLSYKLQAIFIHRRCFYRHNILQKVVWSSDVCAAVYLRFPFPWVMTQRKWAVTSRRFGKNVLSLYASVDMSNCRPLKMTAHCVEKSRTVHQVTKGLSCLAWRAETSGCCFICLRMYEWLDFCQVCFKILLKICAWHTI